MQKFYVSICLLLVVSCKEGQNQKVKALVNDQNYIEYIASYTTGNVSNQSSIILEFTQNLPENENYIDSKLLTFSPKIKGALNQINKRTLAFTPDAPLESGVYYSAKLKLNKIFKDITGDIKVFEFFFQTIEQKVNINFDAISFGTTNQLTGQITIADRASNEAVEKMLVLDYDPSNLKITWDHVNERIHNFTITDIKRDENKDKFINYTVEGKNIGIDKTFEGKIKVPAVKNFTLVSVKFIDQATKYISIVYSDLLDPNQSLQGLITLENEENLSFEIDRNEIKVYLPYPISNNRQFNLYQGIKSKKGYTYDQTYERVLNFRPEKPAVKLVGQGNILPSSNGRIVFPFEAVNLKAIDVKILKIFENNIPHFLQNNRLTGNNQMKRVGRDIIKKTISLETFGHTNLNNWNRFYLDINELAGNDKGSIYQITLSFRQYQSIYPCNYDEGEIPQGEDIKLKNEWKDDFSEYSYWDYYTPSGYEWQQRENPCHISYYTYNRKVFRNIISSDLGLIAKIGQDKKTNIVVTNLLTASPEGNVKITLLDYQLQELGTGQTDGSGFLTLETTLKPFLAIASKNDQYAYLRLGDGTSLSLSSFDISGQAVKKGIKGFIYGERGVWRPGDNIPLTLIIEDKEKNLPVGYPITLEVFNPLGNLHTKLNTVHTSQGMYNFNILTQSEDLTGIWNASIKAGNIVFKKSLKVENVKPNRLKTEMTFSKPYFTKVDPVLKADLISRWLTGVKASGLKAKFNAKMVVIPTNFKGYVNYTFIDRTRTFNTYSETIFENRLDQEGEASIVYKIKSSQKPPGFLKVVIDGKVFEKSGNFSISQFSVPYYPYRTFIGLSLPEGDSRGMLLTGKDHTVDIVTLDAEGKKVSRNNISVEVYKMKWRWWWDQPSNKANYISRQLQKRVSSTRTNTVDGKGKAMFQIKYPDWGRYYVKVCDGVEHCAGKVIYVDWPGWASKGKKGIGVSYLGIQTDKTKYKVGEEVELLIPSSQVGRALITIESSSKIIDKFWVQTKAEVTRFKFEAKSEMTPNVYIYTTLIQPHTQTENDLPIRLYGITGIEVFDEDTKLYPEINLPTEIKPLSEVILNIEEKNGKPMAYTIAIVDEGLLDLTNYKTPSPWHNFYSREGLGVKTWDIYSDVIGAFGGQIERLLAIGGDGFSSDTKDKRSPASRFKPIAIYLGPYFLEKDKKAIHHFKMPAYVGSVRAMVVAGYDGRYGSTEVTVPVKKPLMVLGTLPRVVGPGEQVKLPISLIALQKNLGQVDVEIMTEGVLLIEGTSKNSVKIKKVGDSFVDFDLKVAQREGYGKVLIKATNSSTVSTHEIEINSRNPNPLFSKVVDQILETGQTFNYLLEPFGVEGTNTAVLELSTLKSINLQQRLDYLINYPHGCLEQTISRAFPQLYLSDLVDLDNTQKIEIEHNIKTTLDKITSFQTGEGGFSQWPNNSQIHYWISNYAGHFMLECKNKGYTVDNGILKKWQKFQKKKANQWEKRNPKYDDSYVQAYRLFTLALTGERYLGLMNRFKESKIESVLSRWRLAAAYVLLGQKDVAKSIISNITDIQNVTNNNQNHYSTPLREQAMILETLVLLNDQTRAFNLANLINETLSSDRWLNTQATGYALLAVSKFLIKNAQDNNMNIDFEVEGKTNAIKSAFQIIRQSIPLDGLNSQAINLKNNGSGIVYAKIIMKGKALEQYDKVENKGVVLKVGYFDSNNNIVDPSKVAPGTDLTITVTIIHQGVGETYSNMALTQIFPSGWEILNTRLNNSDPKRFLFDYQDIRDDRVLTYFQLRKGETKIFETQVNTTFKGRYYLPAVLVEEMYDNNVYAKTMGQWVEVSKEGF